QLRLRNDEVDEATRDMELQLSRERAELARERTRLERLREEVKSDLEKLQRESGMRDSLTPVQRLRGEITKGRFATGKTPDDAMNDRVRSMRTRLDEQ